MKITSVDLSSDNANIFSFSLQEASPTDKYFVKTIIGLDADEIVSKFHAFSLQSKYKYFNFVLPKRDIIMRIGLNPNYALNESPSDIRDELYRAIAASRLGVVDLLFNGGGSVQAKISGFITKFEVPYFSKEAELQITIKCIDPVFRGFSPVTLESGELGTSNPFYIADSISTAPHGFAFNCTITGTIADFVIQDQASNPEWYFNVTPFGGFLNGDQLFFSSEYGNRYLYMIRSGVTTPLLDRIDPTSIWPTIFPGANEFHFTRMGSFTWGELTFYPTYWGI